MKCDRLFWKRLTGVYWEFREKQQYSFLRQYACTNIAKTFLVLKVWKYARSQCMEPLSRLKNGTPRDYGAYHYFYHVYYDNAGIAFANVASSSGYLFVPVIDERARTVTLGEIVAPLSLRSNFLEIKKSSVRTYQCSKLLYRMTRIMNFMFAQARVGVFTTALIQT